MIQHHFKLELINVCVIYFWQGWAEFLEDETSQFHDLPLAWEQEGGVPAWIQGSYIKNGPARKEFGDDRYYSNLLDSWAKLHR